MPATAETIADVQARLARIDQLLGELAPAFFAGEGGDAGSRATLLETLRAHIAAPLWPHYQVLAPDFFRWLEAQ